MQSNRYLLLTVVFILMINVLLLSKIGDLNNRFEALSQNYNRLQAEINSISGNVNQALDQFTREQSWITPVQVNEGKTKIEKEQGLAVLNWQIKDYQEGAEVVFHYRQSESGEFKAIPVESKGTGFFEVNVPIEIKVEPSWEVMVSETEGRKTSEPSLRVSKPATQDMGFYVSMKTKDSIKSSEVSYYGLAYLSQTKYEPIQGHVNINDNKYDISLFQHQPSNNHFESVLVKIFYGNNIVAEKAMEVQNNENDRKNYFLSYDAGLQNVSHLVLQVKYSNGNTFEIEIY